MKKRLIATLTIVCLGVSACTSYSPSAEPKVDEITIKGELFYLQRIALAPNSTARFTVYEVPPADASAKEVWHYEMKLANQQVPIPFAFNVDNSLLAANHKYALRAIIKDEQEIRNWTTDSFIAIDNQHKVVDVGAIKLVQSLGVATTAPLVFKAFGNEPGWNFTLNDDHADVVLDYGQTRHNIALPPQQITFAGKHYRSSFNGSVFAIDMLHTPCQDNMSGEKFDYEVALTINGQVLKGCGRYQ